MTQSQYGLIFHYDEENKKLNLDALSNNVIAEFVLPDILTNYDLEKAGYWAESIRQRVPIIVNNFNDNSIYKKGYPDGHLNITKFLSIPVLIKNKIVGLIGVANKLNDYDENDLMQLSLLIDSVWSIIEKNQNEELLKYQENFLTTLTDNLPGMVGYWTKDLICQFANHNYLEWFGKTKEEMLGISMLQLMGEELFSKNKPHIDNVLKGENVNFERTLIKSNGETGYTWAHYIPDLQDNFVKGFYVLVSDITEFKQSQFKLENLNKELQELNATKDKFFSIIAHDLRSPFSGFLGLTKMMSEEMESLSMREMQEFSKNMQDSAVNLFALLENLLQWSRMQRCVTQFNPEMCMLTYLVKQNIDIVNEFAKQKNIQLLYNIPDNFQLTADIPMLNTVLRNLISNAIKFTRKGGLIEIGAMIQPSEGLKPSEGSDVIYIKDSGIGMNEEIINKLFKIDQKVSRPGTEGESSTGLGLLLCKEFIEKHGGKIWVESEEGKGSTFYFSLPIM
jgi:PAS domain S-box-containing protein